jgi:hypothetical protein
VVPFDALDVVLDLERRGITLSRTDAGDLLARPRQLLTDDDRARVRRWKLHIGAILAYCQEADRSVQLHLIS